MSEKIFLDEVLVFEKLGMETKLSEDSASWGQEISSELYKRHPYLSDFNVVIDLGKISPEKGYAFGNADISSVSDGSKNIKLARVPLIVKDKKLQPVDVFFAGETAYPMTESRIKEALFRGNALEATDHTPQDKGIVDQLYPPLRTNYSYGGSGASGTGSASGFGMGKMAEWVLGKSASLISAIAPTITHSDAEEMVSSIESDVALKTATLKNEVFRKLAYYVAANAEKPGEVIKTGQALASNIKPTVVQLEKLASGDVVTRWANPDAFIVREQVISEADAEAAFDTKLVRNLSPGDVVTTSTNEEKNIQDFVVDAKSINKLGHYVCQNEKTGQAEYGYVFPLVDVDGVDRGALAFVSNRGGSVQTKIAGYSSTPSSNPRSDNPRGYGVFYDRNYAVGPVDVTSVVSYGEGDEAITRYHIDVGMGKHAALIPTDGINKVQKLTDIDYAIPSSMHFASLEHNLPVSEDVSDFAKTSAAQTLSNTLEIRGRGGEYWMTGPPVDKLAKEDRTYLNKDRAEFLLVSAGFSSDYAREKLASVADGSIAVVTGARDIIPLSYSMEESREAARQILDELPNLRQNLLKEAAALGDEQTVDKILALNFINAENISTFANYLPELDEALSKVAEMLVASRLGMSQVPEGALEKSLTGLDTVIDGLKKLHQKSLL